MPKIKGSHMNLDENDVITGIVKTRFTILCNLFHHIYKNSLMSIST